MRRSLYAFALCLPIILGASLANAKSVNQKLDAKLNYDLLNAAASGDTMAVRRLAPHGARLEVRDSQNGFTPLMWASWRAQIGTMRELIKRGANVNAKSHLYDASAGVPNIVLRPSNKRNKMGISMDFYVRNQGITPLMLAAASGSGMAIQELLKAGADVKARTLSGESALDMASYAGSLTGVTALLDKGAPLNDTTMAGFSPLLFATMEGQTPIIKLLLARGADATPLFFGRLTLSNLATGAGFPDIAMLLDKARKKQLAERAMKNRKQPKFAKAKESAKETVKIISADGSVEIVQ